MSFVHSSYLIYLLLGLIPIIIYYLMRFRSLKVQWGADYILERALERLKKNLYWEQLVLITLRVLMCLLIVIAFARLVTKSDEKLVSGTGIHRIIILDTSYSMLAGDQSAWDTSMQAMNELVKTWGKGEVWSLVSAGDSPEWVVDSYRVTRPQDSLKKLEGLEPGEFSSSIPRALKSVFQRLPNNQIEVYVFADAQAISWKDVGSVSFPPNASVFWMRGGRAEGQNLAVKSVTLANERCLVDHPNMLEVRLQNFSLEAVQDVEVECLIDGGFFARETVSVLGGQENVIRFPVVFEKSGSHYVTARVKHDVLGYDNSMSSGVDVLPEIRALVLRDAGRKKMLDSVWGALEVANRLNTLKDDDDESVLTKAPVQFALHDKPDLPDLSDVDVVLMDGGRTLTAQLAAQLHTYVQEGGGLLLMADNKIQVDVWNRELGALLPVPLERLQVFPIGEDRFQQLSKDSFSEGALMPFYQAKDGDIEQSKFYTWHSTGELEKDAVVVSRFKNKDPFVVQRRGDHGSVVLCTAGLNGQGNNLMVREFFMPFLYRLVSQASDGGIAPRTVRTNEAMALFVESTEGLRAVTFNLEGDEPRALKVDQKISLPDGSTKSGLGSFLLVHKSSNERVWYGVQGDRMDSDLREIGDDKLAMLSDNKVRIVGTWEELDNILEAEQSGNEWHHWVLLLLFLAITGEMIMQRRFV